MGLNYYASSPTVVLPPQQPSHYFADYNISQHQSAASHIPRRKCPTPPSLNYLAAATNATAGRKRSITDVDDPEENSPDGSLVTQLPPKPKVEPIYGPGMTLIYPDDPGFSIAAESQSGTWCEEKQEKIEKATPERPIAVSRKSQRTDSANDMSIPSLKQQAAERIIDENGNTIDTLITALGVGWKNLMNNEAQRDATRAYTRFIENHYDLTEPVIMLEKEALQAYLVRAKQCGVQGYWLFSDSLQWAQPVGWSLQRTVQNLLAGPVPQVEGGRITARERTPSQTGSPAPDATILDDDAMQM